jgi:hypothetical protein
MHKTTLSQAQTKHVRAVSAAAGASDCCAGGVAVAVVDVRRPLKSTEDAITKVGLPPIPPIQTPTAQAKPFSCAINPESHLISHHHSSGSGASE